jgi:hypothetical protein
MVFSMLRARGPANGGPRGASRRAEHVEYIIWGPRGPEWRASRPAEHVGYTIQGDLEAQPRMVGFETRRRVLQLERDHAWPVVFPMQIVMFFRDGQGPGWAGGPPHCRNRNTERPSPRGTPPEQLVMGRVARTTATQMFLHLVVVNPGAFRGLTILRTTWAHFLLQKGCRANGKEQPAPH